MQEFKPQGFANTVWAFAVIDQADTPMLAASARVVERGMGKFNPQSLANMA